ncbi:aminotransferase class V-fold PLP-dependent enzyme [bacterium]|nr:aminotransferase class V-fold PLP-dependent enzyme [bacterium]
MKRRHFLKATGPGLAGLMTLPELFPPKTSSVPRLPKVIDDVDPHDEAFWSIVRDHFPLTRERVYLNTGGLGASPHVSIHALKAKIDELEEISETGHDAGLWHSIKTHAGRILGCAPEEIAYTRNTTEGVNVVCNGLHLKRNDEIITSTHEHVGNTIAWLIRQKREGIVMRTFEPSMRSAQDNIDRIEKLITKKTKALSISHVTTATGQVLPVKEIGELARAHNLWYFIDGAQSAGMMPLDVHEYGCHAYATSGHKWLVGPKGTGLLYVHKDMLDSIDAKWVGAYSNSGNFDLTTGEVHLNPTAQRYEYGTVSVPLFVGLGASMEFLLRIGVTNIWRRVHAMGAALADGLSDLGAEILSPRHPDEHSAMITFRLKNIDKGKLQPFLAKKHNLRTRGIYEGGLNGIRISLHIYNSFQDVEKVLKGVRAARNL